MANAPQKTYITQQGWEKLSRELQELETVERPKVVDVVSWAAGNGDRSENGDYIYGKKRLREIDRRIRHLSLVLNTADVVDPVTRPKTDKVFFAATVDILRGNGKEETYHIVGKDEIDPGIGKISYISPLARCILGKEVGDELEFETPMGVETIEILDVRYELIPDRDLGDAIMGGGDDDEDDDFDEDDGDEEDK